jgi:hypothetical protein
VITVALQMLLVILLLLTITWCIVIHVRLRKMRLDAEALDDFVARLTEATVRAEQTVRLMQEASRDVEKSLFERDRETRRQSQSLARLVDNAARVASRLSNVVEQGASHLAEFRSSASSDEAGPSGSQGHVDQRDVEPVADMPAREHAPPAPRFAEAIIAAGGSDSATKDFATRERRAETLLADAGVCRFDQSIPELNTCASRNFQTPNFLGEEALYQEMQDKLQALR